MQNVHSAEQPEAGSMGFLFQPERPRKQPDDTAWKLGIALVAMPIVVAGGLAWLLATWSGTWIAPLVAAALVLLVTILTAATKRARGGVFLLSASMAAAAIVNLFGGATSLQHVENPVETLQVSAGSSR